MNIEKNRNDSIKLFLTLYLAPIIAWILLSMLLLIPDETDVDPLTLYEVIIADIAVMIVWFIISFIICVIIGEIKKLKKPIVKEIRYVNVPEKSNNENKKTSVKKANLTPEDKKINNLLMIIFAFSVSSLYITIFAIAFLSGVDYSYGFGFIKYAWVAWLLLPISILSIILGFKYKKNGYDSKKNIVMGFIMSTILFVFGFLCFIKVETIDYSKINEYNYILDVELPSNGEVMMEKYDEYYDKLNYTFINVDYEDENTYKLLYTIKKNSNWILGSEISSKLKVFLPYTITMDNNEYFLIYNKTLDKYNSLPDSEGLYDIYVVVYNNDYKKLNIHSFQYYYK